MSQFYEIYKNHFMTKKQINALFYTMDFDKSGTVSDPEWQDFYNAFVLSFNTCDADADQKLTEVEMTACIAADKGLDNLLDITNTK